MVLGRFEAEKYHHPDLPQENILYVSVDVLKAELSSVALFDALNKTVEGEGPVKTIRKEFLITFPSVPSMRVVAKEAIYGEYSTMLSGGKTDLKEYSACLTYLGTEEVADVDFVRNALRKSGLERINF